MTLENNKSSFICCQHMQQREFIVDCIHSQLLWEIYQRRANHYDCGGSIVF